MPIVYESRKYSQFHPLPDNRNRQIVPGIVRQSINQQNLLHLHPIIVKPMESNNDQFYIIDGQHRWQAAKEFGYTLYYIIDDNADIENLPIHQNQKIWTVEDYCNYYRRSSPDYDFIYKIREKYKISMTFYIKALTRIPDPFPAFRKGKYLLAKRKNLEKTIDDHFHIVKLCQEIIGEDSITHKGMHAILKIIYHDNYNQEHFIEKIKKHKDSVILAFEMRETKNISNTLKDSVYNFNMPRKTNKRIGKEQEDEQ